ncbi:hypothetical protein RIF29_05857 [Crotalaria pallida]|uniref:Uncharacterized protein n=1 Tax=Crotalaria pallida TaxID=3830 RepID=A0AAN9PB60_CROPI
MVNYLLKITADLENLHLLQPQGGCDDPHFSYLFKLKCGRCGELSPRETCVTLSDTVPLPVGKGETHLIQKCKFCGRDGTVTMIPGKGEPLAHWVSQEGKYSPLMLFDCRGVEPVDYVFTGEWKVESFKGTKFENVDLNSGEFAEYDEKGGVPVMISNVRATFEKSEIDLVETGWALRDFRVKGLSSREATILGEDPYC